MHRRPRPLSAKPSFGAFAVRVMMYTRGPDYGGRPQRLAAVLTRRGGGGPGVPGALVDEIDLLVDAPLLSVLRQLQASHRQRPKGLPLCCARYPWTYPGLVDC